MQQQWEKEARKAYGLLQDILQEGNPSLEELAWLNDFLKQNADLADAGFVRNFDHTIQGLQDGSTELSMKELQQLNGQLRKILQARHRFPFGQKDNGTPISLGEAIARQLLERQELLQMLTRSKAVSGLVIYDTQASRPDFLQDYPELEGRYVVDDGYRITSGDNLLDQLPEAFFDYLEEWARTSKDPAIQALVQQG